MDLLGLVAYSEAEFPSARSYYEQSLTLFREADYPTGIASAFLGLGRIAMRQGEYSSARALLQESLSLFRDEKTKHSTIGVLNGLAWVCWHEGEDATARGYLVEAVLNWVEFGDRARDDQFVAATNQALRAGVRAWARPAGEGVRRRE